MGFLTTQIILFVTKGRFTVGRNNGKWVLAIQTVLSVVYSPFNPFKNNPAVKVEASAHPVVTPVIFSRYFLKKEFPHLDIVQNAILYVAILVPSRYLESPSNIH